MKYRYCALVVWYNPDCDVLKNAESYINSVERLYIVDNSELDNKSILERFNYKDKCEYESLHKNTGLAFALDYGCKKATQDGFDYILTMDQDSRFENGAVELLMYHTEKYGFSKYAIVCPNVISVYNDVNTGAEKEAYINWPRDKNKEMLWTMTSGSLMSLSAYSKIKGFNPGLFIQHIDVDLGIQFYLNNLRVIAIGNSILRQRFGNSRPQKLLWKTVHPSHDTPVRTYYRFRNQIYLEKIYGTRTVMKVCSATLWRCAVKNILFETDKLKRIKLMLQGYIDGKNGKLGEYQDE